jgi:hypothetical protein
MIHRILFDREIGRFFTFDFSLRKENAMVVLLNLKQQTRVYNSFYRSHREILQTQMDDATRRKQIGYLWSNLLQHVNEKDLHGLHVQEAMIDYLLIRVHEEALHIPRTTVPVILLPHFQNISHPELRVVVNRLAAFPASAVPVNTLQPAGAIKLSTLFVAAPFQARYDILIDSYNAVRDRRITYPQTIREIARRFFEIENNPEANKYFPYDAGEAARILLRRAKLYEDRARMRERRVGNGNLAAGS